MNALRHASDFLRIVPIILLLSLLGLATATAQTRTYTLDADFDEGTLINVNHNTPGNDQLQLNDRGQAFNFIWVAASNRGTIILINTLTGQVLGEYLSAPATRGRNPSRTTVDADGSVWSGNRNENGTLPVVGGPPTVHGSVVKIGLIVGGTRVDAAGNPTPLGAYLAPPFTYNKCVDRDGDGLIKTSDSLGDVRPWPDVTDGVGSTDGAAHVARVQDADDECILVYQRTPNADAVRHVSVDGSNDVWIGGYPFVQRLFHKLQNSNGALLASFDAAPFGCGGYGGLIDGSNVLWSASISQNSLLRYDLTAGTGACIAVNSSYGLGIDTNGYVWNSMFGNNSIVKISPAGVIQAGFPITTGGASSDRGVAVTPADDHVWVASSGGSDVTRLDNSGALQATITVGTTPTGVAVDAAGKVWVTNLGSNDAMRIDPGTNLVDLTVNLDAVMYMGLSAGPYNYSDMTGSLVTAPPASGSWAVVYNSGAAGTEWGLLTWNANEPGDSQITVEVASAAVAGGPFSSPQTVAQGVDLTIPDGKFLKIIATFDRATTDGDGDGINDSPVLFDLTVRAMPPAVCAVSFLADKKIDVAGHIGSEGDLHSNDKLHLKKGEPSTLTGNLTAVDKIDIDKDNTVVGNVTSGDRVKLKAGATVTGTVTEYANVLPVPLPVLSYSAGGAAVTVPKNTSLNLVPGSYDDVKVEEGATLFLAHDGTSGDYFVEKLELKKEAVLSIDMTLGPVAVYAVKDVKLHKDSEVRITPLGDVASRWVTINSLKKIDVHERVRLLGNYVAPDGTVRLGKESALKGAICAEKIDVKKEGTFLHHASTTPLPIPMVVAGGEAPEAMEPASLTLDALPAQVALAPNYPNPFNPTTTITYTLPEAVYVRIVVYDVRGREVARLFDGAAEAGLHHVVFDATGLPSGVYLTRLEAGSHIVVRTMLLLK